MGEGSDSRGYGFPEDGLVYSRHPDPSWARKAWTSLDGTWKVVHKGVEAEILLPFPIGSEASGVGFRDKGSFVFRRSFELPDFDPGRSWILRIGACDYETRVRVNGIEVGSHIGGYASFAFEIGRTLRPGTNEIELRVQDSHSPFQVRGKQTFLRKPFFVWYGGISGPWQSIWIEEAGPAYLDRAQARVDFEAGRLRLRAWVAPAVAGAGEGLGLEVEIRSPGGGTRLLDCGPVRGDGSLAADFSLEGLADAPWSEEAPNLHALSYRLTRAGEVLDRVESYLGLRQLKVDKEGFWINGKQVFLRMVLVQGYYPGGSYTPQSPGAMAEDIRAIKALGYNGARIHEKVESPYFQYLCDRLGLYTSFEMPSFYLPSGRAFARYEGELRELLARDEAHPSCVLRILFNETWGVWGMYRRGSRTRRFINAMYDLTKSLDPSRPVIENSGWEHFRTEVADFHHYLRTAGLAREVYAGMAAGRQDLLYGFSLGRMLAFNAKVESRTRSLFLERQAGDGDLPLLLSEYGGFGWYHTEGKKEVIEDIEEYTRDILACGLFCGYCYTQLYDVGIEVNGLLGFDRRPKVDVERLARLNREPGQARREPGPPGRPGGRA